MSQFWSVRNAPWDEIPENEKPNSIEEAVRYANLDWQIEQKPVYFLDNPEAELDDTLPMEVMPVPQHFANVRSDNSHPLGIVTKRYVPMHNMEAFAFLAEIFQSEMHFVTAGEFNLGKRVFVVMAIPDHIVVGGDPIGQYATVHTSHDGKHAISVGMTPLRWACQNIITADLRTQRGSGRFIAIRHSNIVEKKIEEARKMLDVTVNYYEQFKSLGDKLARIKPTKSDVENYVNLLLPIDEEQGERHANNIIEARQKIIQINKGKGEGGNTEGNSPGTWWALYNAAIEYADWYVPLRKNGQRLQRMLDDSSGFKSNAFETALAGAGL